MEGLKFEIQVFQIARWLRSNLERRTQNVELRRFFTRYDLDSRLLNFAIRIVRLVEKLPKTRAGNHIGGQLLRSGTSPLPNHGEAQGAESDADFRHKLSICLKELRESERWLQLVKGVPLCEDLSEVDAALGEVDELIRIFKTSVRTVEHRQTTQTGR